MTVVKQPMERELERLYQVFSRCSDPAQVKILMDDLCTIRELHEMSQRLTVAFMLDTGEPYTAIQEKTGASATTIARVSKCLNHGAGGYRSAIDSDR